MKIAVTGGSGQLGTALLRKLALDPKVESITTLDIRPPIVASQKVRYLRADVRDEGFERYLDGSDALFHFAFIVTDFAPREVMHSVNVEGSKNVFRAALAAGVKNIVYSSSIAAYGVVPGHPIPIVEDTPRRYQPGLTYAANKYEVEAFLDEFEAAHPSLTIARLRAGTLLGARMENSLGRALDARILPDFGWPPVPVVWDEDVIDAAILCLEKHARGAFNLVTDAPVTMAQAAEIAGFRRLPIPRTLFAAASHLNVLLYQKLGRKPFGDPAWVENDLPALFYANDKAKNELGWKPKLPTSTDVFKKLGETARGMPNPRVAAFVRLASASLRHLPPREDLIHEHADIHLELTGKGGLDATIHLANGRISIEPGIPRPPTSVLSLRAPLLLDLLAERVSLATLENTGKIHVEGEPVAKLVLSAFSTMLEQQKRQPGLRAKATRKFVDWLAS